MNYSQYERMIAQLITGVESNYKAATQGPTLHYTSHLTQAEAYE